MEFKPLHYAESESLPIFNSRGNAGILTLWNKPEVYETKLRGAHPEVFADDSPLVTLTSLYGNGLAQMFVNLANNPQISRVAVTGNDHPAVPSLEYLTRFLEGEVTSGTYGGIAMNKIRGTEFRVDAQLDPSMFDYLEIRRFATSDLEGVASYIADAPRRDVGESDRKLIELVEPEFSDFPSNIYGHSIVADRPLDAWREVLWTLDRFGKNVDLPNKGPRRALPILDVLIRDASFEDEDELVRWGFNPEELREYQAQILEGKIPKGVNYSYGARLRAQGGDPLVKIAELLEEDKLDRHGFVSLWNTESDLIRRVASPCFTDAYFTQDLETGALCMVAGFRTHNAASAYLTNLYGMRAVQEFVAEEAGMKPGVINLRSRWIGMDPQAPNISTTLEKIKESRKISLDVDDPKGYYVADTSDSEIVLEHFSPAGAKLGEYRGPDAMSIKNQLRQISGFSSSDHAMWVGMELLRAQHKLHGTVEE